MVYRVDQGKKDCTGWTKRSCCSLHVHAVCHLTYLQISLRKCRALNIADGAQFGGHGSSIAGSDWLQTVSIELNENAHIVTQIGLSAHQNERRHGATRALECSSYLGQPSFAHIVQRAWRDNIETHQEHVGVGVAQGAHRVQVSLTIVRGKKEIRSGLGKITKTDRDV